MSGNVGGPRKPAAKGQIAWSLQAAPGVGWGCRGIAFNGFHSKMTAVDQTQGRGVSRGVGRVGANLWDGTPGRPGECTYVLWCSSTCFVLTHRDPGQEAQNLNGFPKPQN